MTILEGNKLIAIFMGGEICGGKIEVVMEDGERGPFVTNRVSELKYHSSWDWLMPVVEKIQSIDITPAPNYRGYRIEIVVSGYVKINGFPMPPISTNVSIGGSLISAVWKAVAQFIQWYNSQPKTDNNDK